MPAKNFTYIYLHGFASSPASAKAQYLHQKFANYNCPLLIPDLNQNDFANLTLTRQLKQVKTLIKQINNPIALIGSSLGGLTATILAQSQPQISKLILLAPAFNLYDSRQNIFTIQQLQNWQQNGKLLIYHTGYKQEVLLKYNFISDLGNYANFCYSRNLPTLIFHGLDDQVVPIKFSRDYAYQHLQTLLVEMKDNHSLIANLATIWQQIKSFVPLA